MRKPLFTVLLMSLVVAAFAVCSVVMGQGAGRKLLDQSRAQRAAGDLQSAAEGFERVAKEFAVSDRNSAAQALLELGDIFQSMGQTSRSRASYEQVRSDFKDQVAEVAAATDRLARSAQRAEAPARVTIRTPYTEDVYSFAISPDGRTLVFQSTAPDGKRQLWRQTVDASAKPEPIAGTEGAGPAIPIAGPSAFPFFSPDGKSIGFFSGQKLWQVDLAGGVAKELADAPTPWGASWNPGGILFSGQGAGGHVQLLENGRVRPVTTVPGLYPWPVFMDDSRFFYFSRDQRGNGALEAGAADGSAVQARGLPQGAAAATYSRGHILFVTRAGSLNAIPFDAKNLTATGTASLVLDRVGREDRYAGIAAFSASAGGALAYRENTTVKRQMLWMDRTGALLGMVGAPDSATPGNPHLSPDGRSVLFLRQVGVSAGSTWIMDTVTGAQRMFQDGGVGAIWSPGGDAVTFCIINNSGPLFVTRAANSAPGAPTAARGRPVVGYGNNCVFPEDISAGGHMVYRMGGYTLPPRGGDVMALPPNQGDPIPVAQAPAAAERNPRFSPDGNWIAYQSDESGRFEIYVQPFPGSAAQRQRVSLGGGTLPQWGRNGRELFFISGTDSRLMVAPAVATVNAEKRNIEFSTPKALFPSPLPQGSEYDVDRAGDRFLVIAPVEDSPPIVVLPNWVPAR